MKLKLWTLMAIAPFCLSAQAQWYGPYAIVRGTSGSSGQIAIPTRYFDFRKLGNYILDGATVQNRTDIPVTAFIQGFLTGVYYLPADPANGRYSPPYPMLEGGCKYYPEATAKIIIQSDDPQVQIENFDRTITCFWRDGVSEEMLIPATKTLGPSNVDKLPTFATTDPSLKYPTTINGLPTSVVSPKLASWVPALYEKFFKISCYIVSLESDARFSQYPAVSNTPGLPREQTYNAGFLHDVKLQGSGITSNGTYIHYEGSGKYSTQPCAVMSNGSCAVDMKHLAVDKRKIPSGAKIAIRYNNGVTAASVNGILFEPVDAGGAIKGNRIDIFFGTRRDACMAHGKRAADVALMSF